MKSLWLFLLIFLSSFEGYTVTKSINILKDKISSQNIEVNKLAAQIKDIDQKISHSNSEYVKRMKNIDELEMKAQKLKTALKDNADKISKDYQLAKISFDKYLLESLDSELEDSDLSNEIYLELLGKKVKELRQAQSFSNQSLKDVNRLEQKIVKMKQDEESLYKIIISLENNKKLFSEKYINILENKNVNQERLDKLISKKQAIRKVYKTKGKIPFKLSLPMENYISIKKTKDGINLKYSETTPILSPRSGKIVYAGELASYGNVVIVDHGKQVRSVLLGDIVTKVKKGDMVKNKQLIGYTVADYGAVKSLYFEVRKKDQAQNAVSWIETKNLKI